MRLPLVVTSVVAVSALIGGLLLVPREDEHVAMLVRDGQYEEAARMLGSMRTAGDQRPEVLTQALLLRLKLGDVPGALEAADAVLAVRPGDRGAAEIRARLWLDSGHLDDYLRAADRLVRSQPAPESLSHLLALYRHHGRHEAELALLQALAGSRHLTLADYERLGALLSARGEWDSAARWLRRVDRHAPAAQTSARLRLLHVLLEGGRTREAQRLAEAWLVQWRDPHLAGKLIVRLAQAGATPSAFALARLCAERMPEATFEVAGLLTESAHMAIARELLARWADLARAPSPEAARSYVHASLAAGEMRKPLEKLLELVHTGAPPEIQAGFAEEIAYAYGPEILAQLIPLLAPGALETRPLLAARIAQLGGNRQLAERYLDRVDPSRLAGHQQSVWLTLLRELKPAPIALQHLLALRESGRMSPELVQLTGG